MKRGRWAPTRLDAAVALLVLALVGAYAIAARRQGFDPYAAVLLVAVLAGFVLVLQAQRRHLRVLERTIVRLADRVLRFEREAHRPRGDRAATGGATTGDRNAATTPPDTSREPAPDVAAQLRDELTGLARSLSAQVHRELRETRLEVEAALERGTRGEGGSRAAHAAEAELERTHLFDDAWYVGRHPDAADDPRGHYARFGARGLRDPHPLFSAGWYLRRHPEAHAWRTPLEHFLAVGAERGYDPHPLFASRWYADRYLEARDSPIPVEHYLDGGWRRGCNPHPLFDVDWYRREHRRWLGDTDEPLTHFLTVGGSLGLDPSRSVDIEDLRRRLLVSGPRDPLTTFLEQEETAVAVAPSSNAGRPPNDPMAEAKYDYLAREVYLRDQSAVLYRIIGNDLPPRHSRGQSLRNVRFILENEPELEGCEKRWILNRITDREQEAELEALLREHGASYVRIPFDESEYRGVGWRFGDFERPGVTYGSALRDLPPTARRVALDHIYHDKNLYIMNNNGARNRALRDGRAESTWVLPWDGNCFVTASAWREFRAAVAAAPHVKYVFVPMARVVDNSTLLDEAITHPALDEPQVAFRFDAAEEFDEDARYGRRPKVRLFYRLGLPGVWDGWTDLPWEHTPREPGPEAGQYITAGWVARLFSGRPGLEASFTDRSVSRFEAIRRHIDDVDERSTRQRFRSDALFFMDDPILERQQWEVRDGQPEWQPLVRALIGEAERALQVDPRSLRQEQGVPTVAGGRSLLTRAFDDPMRLALAWSFTGEAKYADHAAAWLHAWFVDPSTRLDPYLTQAGEPSGTTPAQEPPRITDMRGLAHGIDAIRLIERAGRLAPDTADGVRSWMTAYRTWLEESPQGKAERAASDSRSTWYEAQLAALCSYLDDVRGLLGVYRRLDERRHEHFDLEGCQPHEVHQPASLHECANNLQGWVCLAQAGERLGQDLWRRADLEEPAVALAARWLLPYIDRPWPYEQQVPFDLDRLLVLGHHIDAACPGLVRQLGLALAPEFALRPVFEPEDGIRPYWQFGRIGSGVSAPVPMELTEVAE